MCVAVFFDLPPYMCCWLGSKMVVHPVLFLEGDTDAVYKKAIALHDDDIVQSAKRRRTSGRRRLPAGMEERSGTAEVIFQSGSAPSC